MRPPILLLLSFFLAVEATAGTPSLNGDGSQPEVPAVPVTMPESPAGSVTPVYITPKRAVTTNPRAIKLPKKGGKKKKGDPSASGSDREVVQHQVKESVRRPVNSMSVEAKTIYSYVPDAIYMVYAAVNHVVDVQLQSGETLTGRIVAGDTQRWEVGTVTDGAGTKVTTHVLIKPKQAAIETNFLIVTDKHSYRLYAQASDDFFIPTIGWAYPDEEMEKAAAIKRDQQRLDGMSVAPAIIAANLNFKYKIKADGRYSWTPLRAFDDGSKTYIQMSPKMKSSEAPVFFIRDGKNANLVNYRIRGDYYIIDRLFNEGELRSGKKDKVRIIRESSSSWW